MVLLAGCGGGGTAKLSSTKRAVPTVAQPSTGAVPWPAPANAVQRAQIAGVPVARHEYGIPGYPGEHIHAHLDVFVNGQPARVPAAIGIDIAVPGVNRAVLPDGSTGYGGIKLCARPCIAALHTHDDTGVLHIESQRAQTYSLGQIFKEWNVRLDNKCIGGYCRPTDSILVFVNGDRYTGDPMQLALKDRQEIAIVIGPPPPKIPSKF